MSSIWLFSVAVGVTLVSSALTSCVTYGYCGTDRNSGKRLPCAVRREPVSIRNSDLEGACPALMNSSGESVPVCCDVQQAAAYKYEFVKLLRLGVGKDSKCFKNFENFMCQAFCSPNQSKFLAVFKYSAEGKCQPSATETIYVLDKHFAENVYEACKDVRTRVFGMKLMSFMCGKYGYRKCTARHFFDFVGAVYAEGGHSPLKIRHVLAETPVSVNGLRLEPFKSDIL
ncbi:hypothetical protein MTO96_042533 [Rhipicephalus appendiculatus]|uniref:Niemann-Pick C1 protein n=1 Tax=Rhipicephalus appendiculatus TaxID=34631 RepID=A0A131YT37_RHIAP